MRVYTHSIAEHQTHSVSRAAHHQNTLIGALSLAERVVWLLVFQHAHPTEAVQMAGFWRTDRHTQGQNVGCVFFFFWPMCMELYSGVPTAKKNVCPVQRGPTDFPSMCTAICPTKDCLSQQSICSRWSMYSGGGWFPCENTMEQQQGGNLSTNIAQDGMTICQFFLFNALGWMKKYLQVLPNCTTFPGNLPHWPYIIWNCTSESTDCKKNKLFLHSQAWYNCIILSNFGQLLHILDKKKNNAVLIINTWCAQMIWDKSYKHITQICLEKNINHWWTKNVQNKVNESMKLYMIIVWSKQGWCKVF